MSDLIGWFLVAMMFYLTFGFVFALAVFDSWWSILTWPYDLYKGSNP